MPGSERLRHGVVLLIVGSLPAALSCSDGPAAPPPFPDLRFEPPVLALETNRTGVARLRNNTSTTFGPIALIALEVRDESGAPVAGAQLEPDPTRIPALAGESEEVITLNLALPPGIPAGPYRVALEARLGSRRTSRLDIDFAVPPRSATVAAVTIVSGPASPRQGDVVLYAAEARDATGVPVPSPGLSWRLLPVSAGLIDAGGRFVGYEPGPARIIVSADAVADTAGIQIRSRGTMHGTFEVVSRGSVTSRFTSDLWVQGDVAYTGTWGFRGTGESLREGDLLFAWDIGDPSAPLLTDSVLVEGAAVVNDVKIRSDGTLAVATVEFSGENGIMLLDIADPHHPKVIRRFSPPELGSGSGVHNTWIEGNHLYAVTHRLVVLDVSEPDDPAVVTTYFGGSSFLHDVYVRDGLAFLSHWAAGLIILDVGDGIAGGSPTSPIEVSRIDLPNYLVHNAWYWPEAGYTFLGDEVGIPGVMRVIDVRDPRDPKAAASFAATGAAPHNFWLDEERGILYMAWYENGVIALDVSGELLGQLELQDREIARIRYAEGGLCPFNADSSTQTCTFAPQLENGFLYVADMNTGLWVLRPAF
ncbi:MAG: LVIVD repeat-containing protein [Gemmatimonadota bacterium]